MLVWPINIAAQTPSVARKAAWIATTTASLDSYYSAHLLSTRPDLMEGNRLSFDTPMGHIIGGTLINVTVGALLHRAAPKHPKLVFWGSCVVTGVRGSAFLYNLRF